MRWRSETAASVTGPLPPCIATSIIAVTANRPLVVRRMVWSFRIAPFGAGRTSGTVAA